MMKSLRQLASLRLTSGSFDAVVGRLVGYIGGLAFVPVAIAALVRHPGSRADFLIGLGLSILVGLLLVMLGVLCGHAALQGKVAPRARWLEFVSYGGCLGIMIAGISSLPALGLSPSGVTLGLLVICALGLAVLVLGMLSTVVRFRAITE